jgi:hypothetical protein
VGGLGFSVPKAQDHVSWSRHPSHSASGPTALSWPITKYGVYSPESSQARADIGFLIADGLPTFTQFQEAAAYRLYADWRARAQALGSSLCVVRAADVRGYIEKVRVGAASLSLSLRGDQVVGVRCELIGGGTRQERGVGRSRRVRLPLPGGLTDDRMLMVSSGRDWLDYRFLSLRTRFEDRSDVTFEPPDLCTQVGLVAHEGEGPTIEYKSVLPTDRRSSPPKVVRQAAGACVDRQARSFRVPHRHLVDEFSGLPVTLGAIDVFRCISMHPRPSDKVVRRECQSRDDLQLM